MASMFGSLLKSCGSGIATQLDRVGLEWLSRKIPREGWSKHEADEIQIQIPVSELKKEDIHIHVDANNRLVLRENKLNRMHIQELPLSGNFEKAKIQSSLKDGLVTIKIKNFKRNQVEVQVEGTKEEEEEDDDDNNNDN